MRSILFESEDIFGAIDLSQRFPFSKGLIISQIIEASGVNFDFRYLLVNGETVEIKLMLREAALINFLDSLFKGINAYRVGGK